MNETLDWTKFCMRIQIEQPLSRVYEAWAAKSAIEQWFLEKANYFGANNQPVSPNELVNQGDRFTWKWNNWNFEENGVVLLANNKDRISFTFGPGGKVHIELREKDQGTEVILIQEGIPTDEKSKKEIFVGCSTGWTFWLTNLKALLEHRITLHAKGLSQDETADLVNS